MDHLVLALSVVAQLAALAFLVAGLVLTVRWTRERRHTR